MTRFAALIALLAAAPAALSAADSCIKLDVELLRYSPHGDFIEKGPPGALDFVYDDRFKIQIAGNMPGLFQLVTINPANKKNFDIQPVLSDGASAVTLPCGGAQSCRNGDDFFVFTDDGGAALAEVEVLMIYYFPCRAEDALANRVIKPIADALPSCITALPALREGEFQIARYESIVQGKAKTRVCTPPLDTAGRVVLDQRVDFTVARKR
jgi:hypothetical protein